jgi:hypothetical protein
MILKTPQYCRDRAIECERLAETDTNPVNHEIMLYVAARWSALVEEGEARLKPREPEAPLRAEIAHLGSLARQLTDARTLAAIHGMIHELELRLHHGGNGAAG